MCVCVCVCVQLMYFMGAVYCLGLFYSTLGNLDPVLRSSLKNIHLLCVVKYELIKKYGIEKVMTPIVEALLELEKVTCATVSQCCLQAQTLYHRKKVWYLMLMVFP